jgi:hypothetical protein
MAQSRMYLVCKICKDSQSPKPDFYLARLSSMADPLGSYDLQFKYKRDLQRFLDKHHHNQLNGLQYELDLG